MEPFVAKKALPSRMDRKAEFVQFDEQQRSKLVAVLHALHGDRAHANRAATLAFAEAWLNWKHVRALADPAGWVRRRARSVRSGRGMHAHAEDGEWIAGGVVPVFSAVRSLPVEQRTALVLHHLGELDTAQIAAEEHRTPEQVTELLARAHREIALSAGGNPDSVGSQKNPADGLAQQSMANLGYALS
jgi:predicted RNA polymerase sigma factor